MGGSDIAQVRAGGAANVSDAGPLVNGLARAGQDPEVVLDGQSDHRRADRDLVEVLAGCGFAGPLFERFAEELARYGISVLCGWMYSGHVFRLAAGRGFALRPTDYELEELHRDRDLRQDLADMVVAVALRRFREDALVGGGWRADGGASLTTYFLGTCLSAFPNEFRRYRAQRRRWQVEDALDPAIAGSESLAEADPAELIAEVLGVRDELRQADPRTRAIVALRMDGYHQEEIAEILGEKSARAIEGVLYRWRVRESRRRREGGA